LQSILWSNCSRKLTIKQSRRAKLIFNTPTTALTTNVGRSPSDFYIVLPTSIGVICHAGTIALAVPNRIARTSSSDALLVVIAWINLTNILFSFTFVSFKRNLFYNKELLFCQTIYYLFVKQLTLEWQCRNAVLMTLHCSSAQVLPFSQESVTS